MRQRAFCFGFSFGFGFGFDVDFFVSAFRFVLTEDTGADEALRLVPLFVVTSGVAFVEVFLETACTTLAGLGLGLG